MYTHGEWDDEYTSHINHYVRLRQMQAAKYRNIMKKREKAKEKQLVIDKTLDLFAKKNFRSKYPKELRLAIIMEYEWNTEGKGVKALAEKYGIPADTVRDWVNYKGGNND